MFLVECKIYPRAIKKQGIMMAGYIFNLKDEESLHKCMTEGVYGTIMSLPRNMLWRIHHEGTFADYASMKEGDLIFFHWKKDIWDRKIKKHTNW